MTSVYYLTYGRGAWNVNGEGGTLSAKGTSRGPYYRAPAPGSLMRMPGLNAAMTIRNGASTVNINDLAVYYAVKGLQGKIGAVADGILGPKSDEAIRRWQHVRGLVADGIPGPKTFRAMFEPDARKAALQYGEKIEYMLIGHIGHESGWDLGAVGYSTPQDLGLCQISGRWHPELDEDFRLTPSKSLPWAARFVKENLDYLKGDVDAAILAYNLGKGGATSWVKAGRPEKFYGVDTHAYIASVRKWAVL